MNPDPARPKILIVEDSPTQAERLKYLLERNHYQFATAANGREALAAIAADVPALVISDVIMPEMDGYQLCRLLKHNERSQHIPVILLTALTDPIDVVRALECGADNFIPKPYTEEYLVARIAAVLAKPQARDFAPAPEALEVFFAERKFHITANREQILNLLLSTYENAMERNRELAHARDELRQLAGSLEAKVRERTTALESEVAVRRRAEDEVRRLNTELEERVRVRTVQLEATNRELEAFSFSVSHDLRAPLRHIRGYAALLAKGIDGKAGENVRRYVETIADSAREMNELIENLLEFSRTSRAELRRAPVNLGVLVGEVLSGMEPELRDRRIDWQIESLPTVQADPALMRQVFVNLISNAVKYSRGRETAVINVGTRQEAGDNICFVRDNGAGFDMRYADKLFGVFQRLHRDDEFEGTGIGLANVRRIVLRHGGRTWAEGKPGEGATFSFSLPAVK